MEITRRTILGTPIGKPRMTRRDKWAQRPCVMRYRAWADEARLQCGVLPADPIRVDWVAYLPMPPSWSAKKQLAHAGELHRAKPDRDNIDKAILDSLFEEDRGIATGTIEKRWDDGRGARVELAVYV